MIGKREQALRAAFEPARGGSERHRSEACRVRRLERGAGAPIYLKPRISFDKE